MQYFWPLFMKMDYLSQFSEALAPCDIVTQDRAVSQAYASISQPVMI